MVTAVRLDFGLSKEIRKDPELFQLILGEHIGKLLSKFLNRIRRKTDRHGNPYRFFMNWKIEDSAQKGLHIHTVWYFDSKQVPSYAPTTSIHKAFKELWSTITSDHGNINIIAGGHAKNADTFAVSGSTFDNANTQKHYYTLLSKHDSNLAFEDAYHHQKNAMGFKSGFFHWLSYLAKDGLNVKNTNQVAESIHKRFGTSKNAIC